MDPEAFSFSGGLHVLHHFHLPQAASAGKCKRTMSPAVLLQHQCIGVKYPRTYPVSRRGRIVEEQQPWLDRKHTAMISCHQMLLQVATHNQSHPTWTLRILLGGCWDAGEQQLADWIFPRWIVLRRSSQSCRSQWGVQLRLSLLAGIVQRQGQIHGLAYGWTNSGGNGESKPNRLLRFELRLADEMPLFFH